MRNITKKWVAFARKDMKVAKDLFEKKRWDYSILFCHQTMEKMLKAHIIEQKKTPRKTHDLIRLVKDSSLEMPKPIVHFLDDLTPHYIPTRYPDVTYKVKFVYTRRLAQKFLRETERTFQWLKLKLNQKR